MNPAYTDKLGANIQQGMLMPGVAQQAYNTRKGGEVIQQIANHPGLTLQNKVDQIMERGKQFNLPVTQVDAMIQRAKMDEQRREQEARAVEQMQMQRERQQWAATDQAWQEGKRKEEQEGQIAAMRVFNTEDHSFIEDLPAHAQLAAREAQASKVRLENLKEEQAEKRKTASPFSDLSHYESRPEYKQLVSDYRKNVETMGAPAANRLFLQQVDAVERAGIWSRSKETADVAETVTATDRKFAEDVIVGADSKMDWNGASDWEKLRVREAIAVKKSQQPDWQPSVAELNEIVKAAMDPDGGKFSLTQWVKKWWSSMTGSPEPAEQAKPAGLTDEEWQRLQELEKKRGS